MANDVSILNRLVRNLKERGEDPFTPLLDAYLLDRNKPGKKRLRQYVIDMEPRPRPAGRFSPSSIGGCRRAAAFKFLGVRGRVRIDPEVELVFQDGDWRHHQFQAMAYDMELVLGKRTFRVVSKEADVSIPELFVAGNSDNVFKINGKRYVVDWKGINSYGFQALTRDDEPKEPHERQLMTYEKAMGIPRGLLVYQNKDNQKTRVYPVNFDNSKWLLIQHWIEEVIDLIQRKKLPPIPEDCVQGNYLYEKCPYSRICYGRDDDRTIRRNMYRDFDSVDDLWRRGFDAFNEQTTED